MEALLIISIILSFVALIGVGVLLFKLRGQEKINESALSLAIGKALGDFGGAISREVASANSALTLSIKSEIEHLTGEIRVLGERGSSNHIAIINTLNESFKGVLEANRKNSEAILSKVSEGLEAIRQQTKERLDEIQRAVDEKLDATLSARLKASFDNVIKQIADVNVAVGEIKVLASDVSSLNRVLTNVKTKGIVGEIALENIICEILTPDQYETNFVTKAGTHDPVEFAIKMPGKSDSFVYLPIDAKFPLEAYHEMRDASDELDKERYESAKKSLRSLLKQFAKKIHDKYIDPPTTTDFAIMFLPIEGLYVEALNMGLFEELQREYKINIAGPSTLGALLNALQMGFRSMIIQKRTSQVFELLGAIKTEFGRFGEVLAKAQKKFEEAGVELERLVGTRTRMINAKLREITALDDDLADAILCPPDDEE